MNEKHNGREMDLEIVASAAGRINLEDLKKTNKYDAEYLSARDLQPLLGYSQWRRFEQAIERAKVSCRQSGNDPDHHFAGAGKMVEVGSGGVREVSDFHLSRFACYLIAQNGDPRKPEIAQAQKYFAIQTHHQVGHEVRDAIKRIGGIPPENILPAEHIKEVKRRVKSAVPKLELEDKEAGGLLGKEKE